MDPCERQSEQEVIRRMVFEKPCRGRERGLKLVAQILHPTPIGVHVPIPQPGGGSNMNDAFFSQSKLWRSSRKRNQRVRKTACRFRSSWTSWMTKGCVSMSDTTASKPSQGIRQRRCGGNALPCGAGLTADAIGGGRNDRSIICRQPSRFAPMFKAGYRRSGLECLQTAHGRCRVVR